MIMRKKATDHKHGIASEAGIFSGERPDVKTSRKEYTLQK
jgi:hypothetical protein